MAILVTADEVQAHLGPDRANYPANFTDLVDASEAEQAQEAILAVLRRRFNIATWTSNLTTPTIVRSAISSAIAGQWFARYLSDADSGSSTSQSAMLMGMAYDIAYGLCEGTMELA